ncbi:cathelicidin antimicrobial peptide isoform X1 [Pogoniulus pusillus]|uniref:cathelicidin antimicrobial peptide isoform X1 n=1 Tax=Pogoniulus pusillus TaxID=488313 RepID=UPI0030B9A96B
MALLLGAVLLAAGAAVPPGLPAPRDLARSVLETHGQELKLLKVLGVTRTTFDWGTHFSLNFTARRPACPRRLPERRAASCQPRPGRVSLAPSPSHNLDLGHTKMSPGHSQGRSMPQVQQCRAQVSVFAFLPDVPLSMVECSQELVRPAGAPILGVGDSSRDVSHLLGTFFGCRVKPTLISPSQQPSGSAQHHSSSSPGHPSSSSSSSSSRPPPPRPRHSTGMSLPRAPLGPLSPKEIQ